jgi:hypothetical protein
VIYVDGQEFSAPKEGHLRIEDVIVPEGERSAILIFAENLLSASDNF